MKYIVILGDGMSDRPIPEIGGKTPLEIASIPHMDFLASNGVTGLVKTIPDGFLPGSDVANLSVFGYDPSRYYTGRSALEAVSMGVGLETTDTVFRCNLVTLSGEIDFKNRVMIDYSAGEITSGEARQLIYSIKGELGSEVFEFHAGISYRHCLVWHNGPDSFLPSPLTPPHDILDKRIGSYLPYGGNGSRLLEIMKKSCDILNNHPVNIERKKIGLNPGNALWLWGEGKKPSLETFVQKFGITGSVISAVDLVKGIAICAGLKSVNVAGATGNINTNFSGKAKSTLTELESGADFVYIHVEAPDECGHHGDIENKVKSIEMIDRLILGPLLDRLEKYDEYGILLLPDHSTPIALKTHTPEPVPFVLYRKGASSGPPVASGYSEAEAAKSDIFIDKGHTLMNLFLGGSNLRKEAP